VLQAEPAAASSGSGFTTILFLLLLFGVVYFLMIRPQQKRRREATQMQSSVGPGDRIVTVGGLHGTVVSLDDDVVALEIAPGVDVRFARAAIARKLPQETEGDLPVTEESETGEPFADGSVAETPTVVEQPVQSPVVDKKD